MCVCVLVSTLRQLHRSRLNIHFDESAVSAQESEIEILTQSITTKLRRCEQGIKRIALVGDVAHLSVKERTVRKNSMIMLAQELTQYSKAFRHAQKDFLKSLNEQSGKSSAFGFADEEALKAATDEAHLDEELSEEQRMQLDEINARSNEREKEVLRVARSVHELSTLFSELNVLVIEQGTVLDRIDYNIEQTLVQVKSGVGELEGAEKHSRRALTCKCILILLITVIILIAILVYKKSK
jgi:syntaxin 16